MKTSLPHFRDFPPDFQKETIGEIQKVLFSGKNVQLVGFKGSGKSLLFRSIANMAKFSGDYNVFLIDFNLLPGFAVSDFASLLHTEIEGDLKAAFKSGKKVLFLLDSFDFALTKIPECVNYLKGISDRYREYVFFVFSVEKKVPSPIFLGTPIYMQPLSRGDFEWFWKGIGGSAKYKELVLAQSGGHMGLIKRLNEIIQETGEVEPALQNPRMFTHLNYQLELIKEGMDGDKLNFPIPLFEVFLNGSKDGEFTKLESKAFNLLQKNSGNLTERDDLIAEVWGSGVSTQISEHALDQLIHRLKNKMAGKVIIKTVRGRGYKFIEV